MADDLDGKMRDAAASAPMVILEQIAADLERLNRQHAGEIAALVERQAGERAALLARLSEALANAPADGVLAGIPTDMLTPKEAQYKYGLSKSTLFRLGSSPKNLASKPGGFSFRDGKGDYRYSDTQLGIFLKLRPRRKRRLKNR